MANADALLLQVSADVSKLQKQFDKAQGIVTTSSRRMVATVDAANENIGQKLGRGFGSAIGNNIRAFANQAGFATDALGGLGPAGIAAAAGIAAVGVAFAGAVKAAKFADDIADTANRLSVTTDALQEYRFAIHALGGEYDDADKALEGFAEKFGAAHAQLTKKAAKPFEALGLDATKFKTTEEALRAVTDKISQLASTAEQAAIAEKLGLTPLLPALRAGTAEIDKAREAAHRLGFVMDAEVVKKGGDAADKLEDLSQVLKVQVNSALVDLTPIILDVAGGFADVARAVGELGRFLDALNTWAPSQALLTFAANANNFGKSLGASLGTDRVGQTAIGQSISKFLGGKTNAPQVTMAQLQAAMAAPAPARLGKLKGVGDADSGGGRDTTAADAKARADRLKRVEEDIYRAALDEFDIYNGERRSLEERAAFALERLDIERKHRAAELDGLEAEYKISNGKEGISKAERERLELAEAAVYSGRQRNIRDDAALAQADQRLRYEQDLASLSNDVLSVAESMATTQAERRKIQLEIIESERAIARKALAESLDRNSNLTPDQRAAQLGSFDAGTGALKDRATADTRGPLESYFAGLPTTIAEADEAMQAFAVNGIQSVVDGLTDAVTGARSLKDVFKGVVASMLADITRLNLQRALGGAFANFGGGNLASIASSTIASNPMLFANGTDNAPGGMAWVGERGPELLNIPKGSQVIPNDILRGLTRSPSPVAAGGPSMPAMHFHFSGPVSGADSRRTGRQAAAAFQRQAAGAKRVGY